MPRLPHEYLKHILDEADYLTARSEGLSKEQFLQNDDLKRAFVRSIEIIGEAVKNIPFEFRLKHSRISWREIAGMRDVLIHHYFGINYNIVWDVVINEIPTIRSEIKNIIEQEEGNK